ncbi:MAG: saccharopine dehydrogenase [Actinobacteria bacterium]|nr:MAG: saccharopine dehydrogenase [Actinomycetota bacterium]
MAGRIVLFGATGYTGRLTAEAMVQRGLRPVLAARNVERLRTMGDELGGLEIAVADVSSPDSVQSLVERGDVLLSTVGPFARYGEPAAEASVLAGAHYLDSTGEPAFIRRVFEEYGPRAESAGCGMVTAFGYDWVPGNLAGALALREAGDEATRVAIGYFFTGDPGGGASGGTSASSAGAMLEPMFAWRDGALRIERGAKRIASFDVGGRRRQGISIGASEHFALPRLYPSLRDVDVYLGWFGPLSRPFQAMSAGMAVATLVPGVKAGFEAVASRLVKGSTGGPDAATRAKSGSHIVAVACDSNGRRLAEVRVAGANGYDFTGAILAWGAETAAAGGMRGAGALGPAEAFGLDELEAGCREAGIERLPAAG